MKKNKYFILFIVTIMLCSTLVACSSEESVYNENIAQSPSWDQLHQYNLDQGDFIAMISEQSSAAHAGDAPAPAASIGEMISGLIASLDNAIAEGKITQEQKEIFVEGVHSPEEDMTVMMEIATAAGLDMGVMMSMPEDSGEGMTVDQAAMMANIISVLDEKVAAGEITEEMKLDIITKVHNNEVEIMDVMTQLGISPQ